MSTARAVSSMKKLAVVAISKHGRLLAQKIAQLKKADLYLAEKISSEGDKACRFAGSELQSLMGRLFQEYDAIICIMALGIVVRKIAPYIQDKRYDPAVVVLDELGQSVISVLSGHLGGANSLTRELAKDIHSRAVITTATDLHHKMALDLLAQKWGCEIIPFANLKKISGAVVNDESVAFYSQYREAEALATEQIHVYALEDYQSVVAEKAAVFLTNREIALPKDRVSVFLRPKNVAVGIGCRRGIEMALIEKAVKEALSRCKIAGESVLCFASIDLKQDEAGLVSLADKWRLPIRFYTKEEINQMEDAKAYSQFVKEKIGVNGVCEQTAMLSLKNPQLILGKSVLVPGVTVAVAEERFLL